MNVHIESIQPADILQVIPLIRKINHKTPLDLPESRMKEMIELPNYECIGMYHEGELIGISQANGGLTAAINDHFKDKDLVLPPPSAGQEAGEQNPLVEFLMTIFSMFFGIEPTQVAPQQGVEQEQALSQGAPEGIDPMQYAIQQANAVGATGIVQENGFEAAAETEIQLPPITEAATLLDRSVVQGFPG